MPNSRCVSVCVRMHRQQFFMFFIVYVCVCVCVFVYVCAGLLVFAEVTCSLREFD